MDIVVANGFAMERCTFFSREYHCCVLHNTRCKCEDYNPRNSKPLTNADRIRAKSVEEMAEWLCDVAGWLPTFEGRVHPILEWLRQEASE